MSSSIPININNNTSDNTQTPQHQQCMIASTPFTINNKSGKTIDDSKRSTRTLLNIVPKLPSTDSLCNSPGPASPGNNKFPNNYIDLSDPIIKL